LRDFPIVRGKSAPATVGYQLSAVGKKANGWFIGVWPIADSRQPTASKKQNPRRGELDGGPEAVNC
jgi:hypothetical protein